MSRTLAWDRRSGRRAVARTLSLNPAGGRGEGIVDSIGLAAFRDELSEKLKGITLANGEPMFLDVGKETATGDYGIALRYNASGLTRSLTYTINSVEYPVSDVAFPSGWPGAHERVGVLIAHGPAIRAGVREYAYDFSARIGLKRKASVVDLCPTILYAMGFPVSLEMEGRVLTGLFKDDWLTANPIEYTESYSGCRLSGSKGTVQDKMESEVKEELRAIGYID